MRTYALYVKSNGAIGKTAGEVFAREGEEAATELTIDVSEWAATLDSDVVYTIILKRSDDAVWPILEDATPTDGILTVDLNETAANVSGRVEIQLWAEKTDFTEKSGCLAFHVDASIGTGSEPTVPAAWIATITAAADSAIAAAASAAASELDRSASEDVRVDNETARGISENGRVVAEVVRQSEYSIINLITNPFPTTDITGWLHYSTYSLETVVDGWLRSTKATTKPYPYQNGAWAIPAGHIIYVAMNARANKTTTLTLNLTNAAPAGASLAVKYMALTTADQRFAFLLTPTGIVNFMAFNAGSATVDGDYVEMKNIVMIDLTAEFGAGYEKQIRIDTFLTANYPTTKCFAGTVLYTSAKTVFGNLEFVDNFWRGKKIVWFGTSIPATAYLNGYSYPLLVGERLGATVYNESLTGTGAHIRQIPPEWNGGFPSGMHDLSQTRAEKQAIIDDWANQYTKFTGAPSTLTGAQITAMLDSSYETKLTKYLLGGSVGRCDLYVFDHGYNDGVGTHPVPTDLYDRTTFIGAVNYLVRVILNDNPRARIVFMGHYENDLYPGIVTAQQYIAAYWKMPICPLWERLGWTQRALTTTGYWSGTSPNYTWNASGGASQTLTMKQIALADDLHPHTDASGAAVNLVANEIAGWLRTVR